MKLANYRKPENISKILTGEVKPRLVTVQTAMLMYSRGRNLMMKEAQAAGAVVRAGKKSVTINTAKMDKYYDSGSGE